MQGFLCFIFTRRITKDFGPPSVILSGAKIPIGHPRASSPLPRFFATLENDREWAAPRRILIGFLRSRSFAGRGCAFCNLLQKSAPQQAKPQAMTPGTVLCDVSAGHVTEGLYPVSWRSGICAGF